MAGSSKLVFSGVLIAEKSGWLPRHDESQNERFEEGRRTSGRGTKREDEDAMYAHKGGAENWGRSCQFGHSAV